MKTLIITMSLLVTSITIQAQNKNVLKTTETTVTTIKDSDGEKKLVKQEETQEVQKIQLDNEKSNTLNIDVKASPVEVVKTTQITKDRKSVV